MADPIKFKVEGLAFWAFEDHRFEASAEPYELPNPPKKLRQAILDAADAKVGVRLLKGRED